MKRISIGQRILQQSSNRLLYPAAASLWELWVHTLPPMNTALNSPRDAIVLVLVFITLQQCFRQPFNLWICTQCKLIYTTQSYIILHTHGNWGSKYPIWPSMWCEDPIAKNCQIVFHALKSEILRLHPLPCSACLSPPSSLKTIAAIAGIITFSNRMILSNPTKAGIPPLRPSFPLFCCLLPQAASIWMHSRTVVLCSPPKEEEKSH